VPSFLDLCVHIYVRHFHKHGFVYVGVTKVCTNVFVLLLTCSREKVVAGGFAQTVKFLNPCLDNNLSSRLVASQLAQLSKTENTYKRYFVNFQPCGDYV